MCRVLLIGSFIICFSMACTHTPGQKKQKIYTAKTIQKILIDSVWAANKVSFALTTVYDQQFFAYYNKERMLTVASRKINDSHLKKTILPTKLAWDSHNYVAMGIDELGYIHVSGNMHVNPLVYYRSKLPYNISNMLEINKMVGSEEQDVTYPKFFTDKEGHLYFSYRTGSSGNGNILINRYHTDTQMWERYLPYPLFDGLSAGESRSAYHSLTKDEDGNFQCVWMWRFTPLVETSHQVCYATSADLINWKNAAGESVSLPFKPDNEKLIVDNTPSKGGMHNGRLKVIMTPDKKPLIAYIKYDEAGNTQLYAASFLENNWVSKKISNWDFRWKFIGGGDQMTEGGDFDLKGFSDDGYLLIDWKTEKGTSGSYVLNPKNLELVDKNIVVKPDYPESLYDRISGDSSLSVSIAKDNGTPATPGINYVLKWETMPKSHGTHAPIIIPSKPISALWLLKNKID